MLSKNEFSVLAALQQNPQSSQRQIATATGLSLGSVNAARKDLIERGLLDRDAPTQAGLLELEPHRVDNAIILAAGLSSRFAPISYEKPKGLLEVRGEVLIERQIRQLHEVGITDITVVVGYKKEYFFYLEEKFGVTIAVNSEYAKRNNHSSLMVVREKLRNTFVCSSDNYFVKNPFEAYVYKAYYAVTYIDGPTEEWCVRMGAANRIIDVQIGGADSHVMLGHVYFDRAFSEGFREILEAEYELPATIDKLWEELYIDHIAELEMTARVYPEGEIFEFDTLDELREFDPMFLQNVDSEAFDNIVEALGCEKNDIRDVYPLKQGLTNLSCHIRIGGEEYVYRHPGVGTEEIIDREAEVIAQQMAKELGLDSTFITEDPQKGWKISKYIPNCRQLDPHDSAHVKRAMDMARTLHESDVAVNRSFDFYAEGKRYEALLLERLGVIDVPGYYEMEEKIGRLKAYADADDTYVCLCHNDFFMLNFLIDEDDRISLIDWEYSGMSDYASDFGTFVVCCQLSEEEAEKALAYYFDRAPTDAEIRHNFAYIVLAGWCWYVWSLLKEAEGDIVGEWLYIYYRYAKDYLDKVLGWYEQAEQKGCE
ncbi:phosphotransferase [Eggerthellaceae bacterium 3-80]|nr:winged helix-turn-helix transcriptional regulator [bacterium D16-34]